MKRILCVLLGGLLISVLGSSLVWTQAPAQISGKAKDQSGVGSPGPSAVKASDLIVLIGGRLGEMPSQSYTLFDIPGPKQTLVHVHPGAEELGRVYRPALAINATPSAFAAAEAAHA